MERAEKYGLGIAATGHIVLFGLLSVGFLATPNPLKLETKPIDISLVEDVAAEAAAPAATEAPTTAEAPEVGRPEDAAPPADTVAPSEPAPPQPAPKPAPPPPPARPAPVARPQPKAPPPRPAPPKPQPARPAPEAAAARPAPPQPQPRPRPDRLASVVAGARGDNPAAKAARPRGSLLGDDFRKSLAQAQSPGTATAPRAAKVSATAVAGLGDAIARQVQPCANRIPNPGPGANQIRSRLRLRMRPDGTLAARPVLLGQSGVEGGNDRYADRVAELATSAITQCAPYELPAELYKGGWEDIIVNYRLPG
jgi:outer membrane biosynthesis protein TonB